MASIVISVEVEAALSEGRPVVALETAVTTHGLPREPLDAAARRALGEPWDAHRAVNLETAGLMEDVVRRAGAVPATVGVVNGRLCIGLDAAALRQLATDAGARKISIENLAHALECGHSGGTTVSATLAACTQATPRPIRVMATGGIGGVHVGWTRRPDISADLRQLARTRVCVVCSGAKSIMDLPATVEALETLGVPVLGYRTNCFPRFYAVGDARLTLAQRADSPEQIARICRGHWEVLGAEGGVLAANPVPERYALPEAELGPAVAAANAAADAQAITGAARTPLLLEHLRKATGGRSLLANIALLLDNARLAAEIAAAIPRDP